MKTETPRLDIPPLLLEGDEPSPAEDKEPEALAGPRFPQSTPPNPQPEATVQAEAVTPPSPAPSEVAPAEVRPQVSASAREPSEPTPPTPFAQPPEEVPAASAAAEPPPAAQTAPISEPAALPEAYGTGKLYLLARDPHWVYAHWDIASEELQEYNRRSAGQHLVVRVRPEAGSAPAQEIAVHPESRHCFIHVDQSATAYAAELGYYQPDGHWQPVAASTPAATPRDELSTDRTVRYATIDLGSEPGATAGPSAEEATPTSEGDVAEGGFTAAPTIHEPLRPHVVGWIPAFAPELAAAVEQLAADSSLLFPQLESSEVAAFWTPDKERALTEILKNGKTVVAPTPGARGSAEPVDLAEALDALVARGVSSPLGNAEGPSRNFWLRVDAELVIFGATEPGASVTVGGQAMELREDGTFSLRIALPEGEHVLTVAAVSAAGDTRAARLHFTRQTTQDGG